ncbi:hypothetical protein T01_11205, partial [Trichinella spiralis]
MRKEIRCLELPVFGDASKLAYGAAVYLVAIDKDGKRTVNLVLAKVKLCSVNRSAAYGVQQRRVAALSGRLVHNEISVEQFLSAQSYHTSEPLRL